MCATRLADDQNRRDQRTNGRRHWNTREPACFPPNDMCVIPSPSPLQFPSNQIIMRLCMIEEWLRDGIVTGCCFQLLTLLFLSLVLQLTCTPSWTSTLHFRPLICLPERRKTSAKKSTPILLQTPQRRRHWSCRQRINITFFAQHITHGGNGAPIKSVAEISRVGLIDVLRMSSFIFIHLPREEE